MTDKDERYNGWKNYATWGVALVLDNDEESYNHVREHITELRENIEIHPNVLAEIWSIESASKFEMADFLKDYTEELCGLGSEAYGVPELSLMTQQLLSAGMAEVYWDELASNYLSE